MADAAYCIRAYRLNRVDKVLPTAAGQRRRELGTAAHRAHGATYARQRGAHRAMVLLSVVGAVLIAFFVLRALR